MKNFLVKKFSRKIEDFFCEKCGNFTKGSGYTDHCPKCLWSKHVDENPGDRQAKCLGLMEPIRVESKKDGHIIYYKCTKCGFHHKVKSAQDDDFEKILEIMKNSAK